MRNLFLALAAVAFFGCASSGLHPGYHPTPTPSMDAGGTSLGLAYAKPSEGDSSSLSLPYGEGWIRFGGSSGQSTVRVTPGLGWFSYRIEVTGPDDSVGVGIEPGIGAGYWTTVVDSGTGSENTSGGVLAPNAAVLLFLADRALYIAPRFGYSHLVSEGDSTGIISLGGAIGYEFEVDPFLFSIEGSFLRLSSTEEGASGSVLVFSPSFGIQLTRPTGPAPEAPPAPAG